VRVRALAVVLGLLLTVVVGAVLAGDVVQAAPAGSTVAGVAGCVSTQDCGHASGSSVQAGQPQAPSSCVQRTACGGGAALALGGFVLVAALVASGDSVAARPSTWAVRVPVRIVTDRLTAGRLFRPPRFTF
jgi:hypothetical protein